MSIVDVNDLRYLFLHVHRDESTSLNYAFRASNQDNLTAYINALSQLMIEKIITYSEFGSLLTRFNSKLSTALTSASMSKNPDHLCYYFTLLKWAKSNGCITAETYKTTLITPTFERFTPLHSVLTSKHELSLALYLEALDDADLYSDEWFHLLTCRHKFGLNPLKQALDTKQITIINLYMDALYSVLPLFENHELQNFLLGTNNAVKNPLNFLILCGNYDLVCKFLSIIVHRFGQEFLMRELKQSHSQGTPKYYYHKKDGVEGIQINRLIDTIRAGLTLTEAMESIAIPSKASQMTIIDDLPDTKEPTEEPTEEPIERKRPRMESTMGMPESRMPSVSMVVPGQNLMGPLRQSLGLSAPQIKPPSTVSELMLRTIRDTAQAVTATTALAPQSQITGFLPDDLTMSITRKLIHIAQTIVYQYGLDPAHICFYGSTAQLVVGHRPDSSLPKDIDLRLFVYESALVRIQQNLLSKQKSLKIEDAGRFLLVKGFAVEGIDLSDSIDIQVIKMRDGDRVLDYIDTLRWSSYLNVCTDYCIFNAPNTLIPCPGPSHESRVKFIDPRGVEIPQVDDLFQLYGAPYDLKAKDLFFFLKKWDYYSNAGYDVVALKQAIINTMAYQYGFELGKQIFSRSDKLGMRLGAQMIYKLCGKDYIYHPDDAFEMHHHELLKMVDPRIISVLYVNRNEAVAIRLNIPQRYSVAPAGSGHGFFSGSSAASAYTALSHSGAQAAPPPSECAMPQT